jgi:hypothetical protein
MPGAGSGAVRLDLSLVRRDRCDRCHLSAQVLEDAMGSDVPSTSEHDVERLAALVVTGLRVEMVVYGL